MYDIVKNVIKSKKYELRDILKKLDVLWVQGSITEEERTELISLAQGSAETGNSVDLLRKLEEVDKRVKVLEEMLLNTDEEDAENPTEAYPEYEVGKWYYSGDKISFDGANYICTAPDGQVCTWNPVEYPAYWELMSNSSN